MKLIRFLDANGVVHHGAMGSDGTTTLLEGDLFGEYRVTDRRTEVHKLLAPVVPTIFLGIGLNYRRHAAESQLPLPQYPVLFIKAATAAQNPNDPIVLPRRLASEEVDYECELAVVIGRRCKNVSRQEALEYVLGYTAANDVSARDWQRRWGGTQWCRGKTFDTFAPLGPCLVTRDEIPDPQNLRLKTILNGQLMQDGHTSDMIFDVPRLIEFLSGSTTLLPGTVILTGTPHGVGMARNPPVWLRPGDTVSVEVEHIGILTNPVVEEELGPR